MQLVKKRPFQCVSTSLARKSGVILLFAKQLYIHCHTLSIFPTVLLVVRTVLQPNKQSDQIPIILSAFAMTDVFRLHSLFYNLNISMDILHKKDALAKML